MRYDVLHNFISPHTGYILSPRNYVPFGNKQGIAKPSPILMDMRFDILENHREIEKIHASNFVLQTANSSFPNAQNLEDIGLGMVKISDHGILEHAKAGLVPEIDDYVDPLSLEAALASHGGRILEDVNETLQNALYPYTWVVDAMTYGQEIHHDIRDTINNTELSIIGDVAGSGKLGDDNIELKFTPNSVLIGDQVTVPPVIEMGTTTTVPTQSNSVFLQQINLT